MHSNFTAATLWRPVQRDPLILDIDGDGLETIGLRQSLTKFDHDADGIKTATGWVSPDDAFLVLDRNGNGLIDNGTELFGDATPLYIGGKAIDGFAALNQEDTNTDGKVNHLDKNWKVLQIWSDKNQDGISQTNELSSVVQAGIVEINTNKTAVNQALLNGNLIADIGSFTTVGGIHFLGNSSNMGDVNLAEDPFYRSFIEDFVPDASIKMLPNALGSGKSRDLLEAASLSDSLRTLLSNFSAISSKNEQLNLMDDLLEAWADTSLMAKTLSEHAGQSYEVKYSNIGTEFINSYSVSEWDKIVDNLEKNIHILEAFNGKYLFHLPGDGGVSGSVLGLSFGGLLSSGKTSLLVSMSSEQVAFLDSAYAHLKSETFHTLTLQTRLHTYFEQVSVTLGLAGIKTDFTKLNAFIQDKLLIDPEGTLIDLVDLIKFSSSSWVLSGWKGLQILSDFIENSSLTPELQEIYSSIQLVILTDDSSVSEYQPYIFGSTNKDHIVGGYNANVIMGSLGDDVISDSNGSDMIDGGAGNDTITDKGRGTNVLHGGEGDDRIIFSSTANNTVEGGSGNDILESDNTSPSTSVGIATLIGGTGNDKMYGGAGLDNYVINRGHGVDMIYASNANDKLVFGAGIAQSDLQFGRASGTFDLVVKIADAQNAAATDQVTMKNWFVGASYQTSIVIADGTTLDIGLVGVSNLSLSLVF